MKLSTFKRNWMLHYIQPEYLYLPRNTQEPVPEPTEWRYRIKIHINVDFFEIEDYEHSNYHSMQPVFCLKEKNKMIFFEEIEEKRERKTATINGITKTYWFWYFKPIQYRDNLTQIPVLCNDRESNALFGGYDKNNDREDNYNTAIFCFDKNYQIEWYDYNCTRCKINLDTIFLLPLSYVANEEAEEINESIISYQPAFLDIVANGLIEQDSNITEFSYTSEKADEFSAGDILIRGTGTLNNNRVVSVTNEYFEQACAILVHSSEGAVWTFNSQPAYKYKGFARKYKISNNCNTEAFEINSTLSFSSTSSQSRYIDTQLFTKEQYRVGQVIENAGGPTGVPYYYRDPLHPGEWIEYFDTAKFERGEGYDIILKSNIGEKVVPVFQASYYNYYDCQIINDTKLQGEIQRFDIPLESTDMKTLTSIFSQFETNIDIQGSYSTTPQKISLENLIAEKLDSWNYNLKHYGGTEHTPFGTSQWPPEEAFDPEHSEIYYSSLYANSGFAYSTGWYKVIAKGVQGQKLFENYVGGTKYHTDTTISANAKQLIYRGNKYEISLEQIYRAVDPAYATEKTWTDTDISAGDDGSPTNVIFGVPPTTPDLLMQGEYHEKSVNRTISPLPKFDILAQRIGIGLITYYDSTAFTKYSMRIIALNTITNPHYPVVTYFKKRTNFGRTAIDNYIAEEPFDSKLPDILYRIYVDTQRSSLTLQDFL